MKFLSLLIIAIVFYFAQEIQYIEASEQKCRKLPDQVEKSIKKHAREKRGAEYCEYRDITEGDIDGNITVDLIIAYNIEGACYNQTDMPAGSCSNNHTTFLTVFLKHQKGLKQMKPIKVGGRGERSIVALRVRNGHIEGDTLEYNESDALCYPSKQGRASFVLIDGELKEIR